MRVKVCRRHWDLVFCPLRSDMGQCDAPDVKRKQIRINRKLRDADELETLIHELLHAANWTTSEEHVEEAAEDIARVLWRLGYRKASAEESPPA